MPAVRRLFGFLHRRCHPATTVVSGISRVERGGVVSFLPSQAESSVIIANIISVNGSSSSYNLL